MKPKLFENNLTVHKLLGDVSEDEFEVRYLEVDKVKDEVVELYQEWDSCMTAVSQQLLGAEDNEKKLNSIESDLAGLSSFLRRESAGLVRVLTSTDSGISDSSEARLGREISGEERRLTNIQHRLGGLARQVRQGRQGRVSRDLAESRRQLRLLRSLLALPPSSQAPARRRRRLLTYWRLATCWLLFLLVLLVVVTRPRCCDHSSLSHFFLLHYTGGPRPI